MRSGPARPLSAYVLSAWVLMALLAILPGCVSARSEGTDAAPAPSPSTVSTSTTTTEAPDPDRDVIEGRAPSWVYDVDETTDAVSGASTTVVRPRFDGGTHDGKLPLLSSAIDDLTDEVVARFMADAESADELAARSQNFLPSGLTVVGDVLLSSPAIVAVEFTVSQSIAGTARPTLDYRTIVWDLPRGRQLTGPDLVVSAAAFEQLGALALDRIAARFEDAGVRRGDLSVQPFVDGFAAVSPTSGGIRVAFGRDELLPGAFGEGAVTTLPWEAVGELVTPRIGRIQDAPTARGEARPQTQQLQLAPGGLHGIAFGAPPDAVIPAVVAVLGPPGDDSGFLASQELCDSPPTPVLRRVGWGALTLWFTPDGGFVEWHLTDGLNPVAAATVEGIGLGSTVAAVEEAYSRQLRGGGVRPLFPDDPELSEGLFEVRTEAGTITGVTDAREPDGTVTELWAGAGCGHLG